MHDLKTSNLPHIEQNTKDKLKSSPSLTGQSDQDSMVSEACCYRDTYMKFYSGKYLHAITTEDAEFLLQNDTERNDISL